MSRRRGLLTGVLTGIGVAVVGLVLYWQWSASEKRWISLLTAEEKIARVAAAHRLARIGTIRSIRPLIDAANATHRKLSIIVGREESPWMVGTLHTRASLGDVVRFGDPAFLDALEAVCARERDAAALALLDETTDEDWYIRYLAATFLRVTGTLDTAVLDGLARLVVHDDMHRVRGAAEYSLKCLDPAFLVSIDLLLHQLESEKASVSALRLLRQSKQRPPELESILLRSLDSKSDTARIDAAAALLEMDPSFGRARAILEELSESKYYGLRARARRQLSRVSEREADPHSDR